MGSLLASSERSALEKLVQGEPHKLQRPAQIILLTDQGLSIRQIAAQLEVSRSGVFYWIRRFRSQKMAIFNPFLTIETISDQNQPESETDPELEQLEPADLKRKSKKVGSKQHSKVVRDSLFSEIPKDNLPNSPGLLPDDTLSEAARKTLWYHFIQMLKNEAGTVSGKDIEALHDMRVATRRMRAAFNVLGFAFKANAVKPFIKGLRQTGRVLGRVRDMDVLMEKAARYLEILPPTEQRGLDPLLKVWRNQRDQERQSMIAYLGSSEYRDFVLQFKVFLQTPGAGKADSQNLALAGVKKGNQPAIPDLVRHAVPLLVYTRLAAVNSFEALLPTATIVQLHSLRIEFKYLRYTIEFFVEVLGPQAKWVIQEIKNIQDHLGDLNDAEVASLLLGNILNTWEDQHRQISIDERPDPLPLLNYLTYRIKERHELIQGFPEVWERFNQPDIRKNLAFSIAVL